MTLISENSPCPLCGTIISEIFYQDKRDYYQCSECYLIFVPPQFFLSRFEEKQIYDHHENSPDDLRYRQFLSRLFEPVNRRLKPHSFGLDFGSGPGPTLSLMLTEVGHSMHIFDPFYASDTQVLKQQYDFITASEVVEHLHHPREEFERLWSSLRPSGILGIMTKRATDKQAFSTWHYKNDPTHVCFYSVETFLWLATLWNAEISFPENDVVLLTK